MRAPKLPAKAQTLRKIYQQRRKDFEKRKSELRSDLLMSGVAHEFNNILGAADGHAEWALDTQKPEDMVEALKVVRIACQRSATITRALRGVSQPREEREEELPFADVVEEFRRVLAPLLQKFRARLEIRVPEGLRIRAIRNEILEVFLNLAKNSLEAASAAGQVPELSMVGVRLKQEVVLKFYDNGPGVAPALEDLIFQPFFTTKGVLGNVTPQWKSDPDRLEALSSGTGLGLFWSQKICQEMGGSLRLKRDPKTARSHFELRLKIF